MIKNNFKKSLLKVLLQIKFQGSKFKHKTGTDQLYAAAFPVDWVQRLHKEKKKVFPFLLYISWRKNPQTELLTQRSEKPNKNMLFHTFIHHIIQVYLSFPSQDRYNTPEHLS